MNRRKFLGSANCAAISSVGILNTLVNLRMIGNAAAASSPGNDDYRALVCLFLHGGNDSYNMLIPTGTSEHANYAAIRSNLALPAPGSGDPRAILPINATNTGGRSFGLHHSLTEMQGLFNSQNLSFISNVGTLVEPTTVAQYKSGSVTLPRSLFSHNDQQREWQTSVPQANLKTGWAGRLADRVSAVNTSNEVSMNISLDGTNLLQTGDSSFAYAIDSQGAKLLTGAQSGLSAELNRVNGAKSLVEKNYRDVLRRAFAEEASRGFDAGEAFSSAFEVAEVSTPFPDSSVARDLQAVARSIAARDTFGHKRQIFFVQQRGFDNHAELLESHESLMSHLDANLKAFWDSLVELGVEDQVTLFSCSDFGRTLRSNGLGTDHAWGGHSFVMGGCVDGGKIFGEYPDQSQLSIGNGLDVGFNGRLLPTTSCDEYFAELALWFGLSPNDLLEVFPNLGNFYSHSDNTPPLGFLL